VPEVPHIEPAGQLRHDVPVTSEIWPEAHGVGTPAGSGQMKPEGQAAHVVAAKDDHVPGRHLRGEVSTPPGQ
jgi:hypothetical protein